MSEADPPKLTFIPYVSENSLLKVTFNDDRLHCAASVTLNDAGLALIESFESEKLRAYPDPATGGDPWTIGWGHTANVHPGQTCTHEQALAFLQTDVQAAEQEVSRLVQVQLTSNQRSALVSFEYNTGGLADSTLLRYVNEKKFALASNEFLRWVYANGQKMDGLVRRRAAERSLFDRG